MGNTPSEYNGAKCSDCEKSLPPCKTWNQLTSKIIEGRKVFIFLGGLYYRRVGSTHKCPDCFWRPIKEMQRNEKKQEERKLEAKEKLQENATNLRQNVTLKQNQEIEVERKTELSKAVLESHSNKFTFESDRDGGLLNLIQSSVGDSPTDKLISDMLDLDMHQMTKKDIQQCLGAACDILYNQVPSANQSDQQRHLCRLQLLLMEIYILNAREVNKELLISDEQIGVLLYEITKSALNAHELFSFTDSLFLTVVCSLSTKKAREQQPPRLSGDMARWRTKDCPLFQMCSVDFLQSLLRNSKGSPPDIRDDPKTRQKQDTLQWPRECCQLLIETFFSDSKELGACVSQKLICLARGRRWLADQVLELLEAISQVFPANGDELREILHIIVTNQMEPVDINKPNQRSIAEMLKNGETKQVLDALRKGREEENEKSLEVVFSEIQRTEMVDAVVLREVETIVRSALSRLTKLDYPAKPSKLELSMTLKSGISRIPSLMRSLKETNLQADDDDILSECLCIICCAVHKSYGFWPRLVQMVSWCILVLSGKNGRLLQIATGEGKSVVIAMFAAYNAMRSKQVDIVTSSPVLAARDARESAGFYELFSLTVSCNVDLARTKQRVECYKSNIVYGTVENYAADILRQEFQLKEVRSNRRFDVTIVDEIDSLLLDQGIQFTYLSNDAPFLQHLEPVLAMVWAATQKYSEVEAKGGEKLMRSTAMPFHLAVFDSIEPGEFDSIENPLQLLKLAEENGLVARGVTEKMDAEGQQILDSVKSETIMKFLTLAEDYLPCRFIPYVDAKNGTIAAVGNRQLTSSDGRKNILIQVSENGVCRQLYSRESLVKKLVNSVQSRLEFDDEPKQEMSLSLPKCLSVLTENRLPIWVDNAMLAMQFTEGRQYLVKDGRVIPVAYDSTGVAEINKRWGGGLHQFLQMKHFLGITPMSMVTNFMSNSEFFKRYAGSIFGLSGTLGTKTDHEFLKRHHNLDVAVIPTYQARKLYEVEGRMSNGADDWLKTICDTVKEAIAPTPWGGKGRTVLVLCEDIRTAGKVSEEIKSKVTDLVTLYTNTSTIAGQGVNRRFSSQEVVVATNLAGRGTNIKMSKDAIESGGLFVLMTFLPVNTRVELQAFGRAARSGQPGSGQIILNTEDLKFIFANSPTVRKVKDFREQMGRQRMEFSENYEIKEMELKEKLFQWYNGFARGVYNEMKSVNKSEKKIILNSLHDAWGMWLLMEEDRIENLEEAVLMEKLKVKCQEAKALVMSRRSPTANFHHAIKFGNDNLLKAKYEEAIDYFSKSIDIEENWSTIAFYNRAYCAVMLGLDNYIGEAVSDLEKSLEKLSNYEMQHQITFQLIQLSQRKGGGKKPFFEQMTTRFQILKFYKKNIKGAIGKLKEIQSSGRDAQVEALGVFSLIPDADTTTSLEMYRLWQLGLLNVYSVEEKPRFCWEGLVVLLLGVAQVAAGALLTVFSAGTLSSIGMGLIGEGLSDVIDGIIGMVEGEMDLKEWAISKAAGIAISMAGFGVAKLVSKGIKGAYQGLKVVGKGMKALPKIIAREAKDAALSVAVKNNLKNTGKYIGKEIAKTTVMKTVEACEEKLLEEFMGLIQRKIKANIKDEISKSVNGGNLSLLVNKVLAEQVPEGEPLEIIAKAEDDTKNNIKKAFESMARQVVQPFILDPTWKEHLSGAVNSIAGSIKEEFDGKGKWRAFAIFIETLDVTVDIGTGMAAIIKLKQEFDTRLIEQLVSYCKEKKLSTTTDIKEEDEIHLLSLKNEIADVLADVLSGAISTITQNKVAKYLIERVQEKVNSIVEDYVTTKLNISDTEEKISAVGMEIHGKFRISKRNSMNFAMVSDFVTRMKEKQSRGSMFELEILCKRLGVTVAVFREGKQGRKLMTTIKGETGKDEETVQLVQRANTQGNLESRYDVLVNGNVLRINGEDKGSLYRAAARGLNPSCSEDDLTKRASELREMVATELKDNFVSWAGHVERSVWMSNFVSGGMGSGGAAPHGKKKSGKTVTDVLGTKAAMDTPSKLAGALGVSREGTGSSQKILSNRVMAPHYRIFFGADVKGKLRALRPSVIKAIESNDVVKMLKFSFVASATEGLKFLETTGALLGRLRGGLSAVDASSAKESEEFKKITNAYHSVLSQSGQMTDKQKGEVQQWVGRNGFSDPQDSSARYVMAMLLVSLMAGDQ